MTTGPLVGEIERGEEKGEGRGKEESCGENKSQPTNQGGLFLEVGEVRCPSEINVLDKGAPSHDDGYVLWHV